MVPGVIAGLVVAGIFIFILHFFRSWKKWLVRLCAAYTFFWRFQSLWD